MGVEDFTTPNPASFLSISSPVRLVPAGVAAKLRSMASSAFLTVRNVWAART
jgi:hypothetical protein